MREEQACWGSVIAANADSASALPLSREFAITPLAEDKVRFTHVEDVHGLLFPVFRALMGSAIQRHHDALNAALKNRAEALATQAAAEPS